MRRHLRRTVNRVRVAGSLTLAQVRQHPLQFVFAILGVGLAVLALTLLAGTGLGVLEVGEQQFETADRDLWLTGTNPQLVAAGGGGFENSIYDSRNLTRELETHDGVDNAVPLAFETVYVGTDTDSEFQTVIGVGSPGAGSAVQITEGRTFHGDPHYADGTYEGEMSHEVILDEETARNLNVSPGETLHIGGSLAAARSNEFTVVGISPTFEQMLGTSTVTVPLSELYEVTGTTQIEPATFITITVEEGYDSATVQQELDAAYPEYEIRSNQQQLEAVLQEQVLVIAAGATLVVLAIVAGIALTTTLLGLVVYQQRQTLGALKAQGISSSLLVLTVIGQGLLIGLVGAGIGLVLTSPLAIILNHIMESIIGFDGLVQPSQQVYLGGGAIAIVIGIIAAAVAGWRVNRVSPLQYL